MAFVAVGGTVVAARLGYGRLLDDHRQNSVRISGGGEARPAATPPAWCCCRTFLQHHQPSRWNHC